MARRMRVLLTVMVTDGVAPALAAGTCVPLVGEGSLPLSVHAIVAPGVAQEMVTVCAVS